MDKDELYSYKLESIMIERTLTLIQRLGCRVFKDGSMWCCLYGTNLQEGIGGFGKTPQLAIAAFEYEWLTGMVQP